MWDFPHRFRYRRPWDFPRGIREDLLREGLSFMRERMYNKTEEKNRKVLRRQRTDDPVAECAADRPRKRFGHAREPFARRREDRGRRGSDPPSRCGGCRLHGPLRGAGPCGHARPPARPGPDAEGGRVLGLPRGGGRRRDDAIVHAEHNPRARHARANPRRARKGGKGDRPRLRGRRFDGGAQRGGPHRPCGLKGRGRRGVFRRRPPRFEQPLNGGGFARGRQAFRAGRFPLRGFVPFGRREDQRRGSKPFPRRAGRARGRGGLRHGAGLGPCRGVQRARPHLPRQHAHECRLNPRL